LGGAAARQGGRQTFLTPWLADDDNGEKKTATIMQARGCGILQPPLCRDLILRYQIQSGVREGAKGTKNKEQTPAPYKVKLRKRN